MKALPFDRRRLAVVPLRHRQQSHPGILDGMGPRLDSPMVHQIEENPDLIMVTTLWYINIDPGFFSGLED